MNAKRLLPMKNAASFREDRSVVSSLSPCSPDLEVADGLQIGGKCCKVAAHTEEGEEKLMEERCLLCGDM